MSGKPTNKKCISYFDLLGTKAAAQRSPKQYELLIREFRDAIIGATEHFVHSRDRIWVFSDCAYVETENVEKMIEFYQILRECLIPKGVFFTAAIDIGELKTLPPNKTPTSTKRELSQPQNISSAQLGAFFIGSDTARLYAQQATLSGIGIVCGHQVQVGHSEQLCLSYYYATRDCSEIVKFWDLKYETPSISMLELIVAQLVKTRFENLQASRYYLTAIVSLLKSFDIEQLEDSELWKIVTCCCLKNSFFTRIRDSFRREINIFVIVILQLLLDNTDRISDFSGKIKKVISIAEMDVAEVIALYHDSMIRQVIEPEKESLLLDRLLLLRSDC